MKILIGADTYAPDVNGASYFAQRLATALAGRHEVHVVCPSTGYASRSTATESGIVEHRVRSLPVLRRRGFRFCAPVRLVAAARRILTEVRPDVVHVQSHFPLCRALIEAAAGLGIPVVATNHFMPENLTHYVPVGDLGRRRLHEWAWRDLAGVYGRAAVVTAPTPYAAALAERAGVPGPVLPISCGMDLSRFGTGHNSAGFRLRYGVPARPTIGYVGRLDKEKNIDVVVRALARVRRHVDAQLMLVGTGAERGRLAALAADLGVADALVFTGFVADADLPAAYAATDVFVNAGTAELQSLVTLEAMACGVPVVGADASALPHLVRPGDNGLLFPPGDDAALADRLLAILADPARAAAMGRRSRTLAEEHDEARTIAAFEEIYARVGGQRSTVPAATVPALRVSA
ncbi:glycosyltransferase [Polymorphospora sp. NPDC050346]|uniref:glycosyltransferase n=1 Tax=Polymorphospora sp. NPDC050346 TaxID=3155780 RepID=UPI0033C240ED